MKSELPILAKNKETMDRLDRTDSNLSSLITRNNEAIRQLQEDNYNMAERVNHLESQQENRKYLTEYTQNTDNSVARWFV